ncbi:MULTISPECIES: rhodanese-like domain-containing protein [unclassified Vibrio]|uniref:rhodanese-like domain-containing protein n=1 Tax=unclassified Vibrio TaxID=2614977 RepID=UPI000B8E6265|nr:MULTISPECIES: rhodanese-like domain-containing protein [unclassified Vibrio]NAX19421.1 rhodanese-like domain-containing protein [Vibrio sp. V22_P2S10T140]OXX44460.1 sulfurtransferase [Vibrio sp. V07_P2A8T137]OXX52910.1 sulfurtransferase [Vibrio sp. V10_P2A27P122]PSD42337.1 rhodanese-like domain-containing protein [Vibrio sp. V02_P2A34T13]
MLKSLMTKALLCVGLISNTSDALASERSTIAWQWIENGALLVDVRTAAEFAVGHIEGALNYPLDTVSSAFSHIDKQQPIVVYCRSGNRSGQAMAYLLEQGFTQVHNGGGLEEMIIHPSAIKPLN